MESQLNPYETQPYYPQKMVPGTNFIHPWKNVPGTNFLDFTPIFTSKGYLFLVGDSIS